MRYTPSSVLRDVADRMQRAIARSPVLVRAAVLVRNQARCVIKYHLAQSPNVGHTGEMWLCESVAGNARTFLDVGANVGDWLAGVVEAKGSSPFSAVAFEPSTSAREVLEARFGEDARIEIVPNALGDVPGTMNFLEERNAGKGSSLVPGLGRIVGETRTVAVTTIDDELARRGWEGADFVKIDAEGYDARVLKGALKALAAQRLGVVQFEYNRWWQMAGETLYGAYRLLEDHGYRVFLLRREGLYILNYARYEEYFEYSNFVALAPEWMERLGPKVRGTI